MKNYLNGLSGADVCTFLCLLPWHIIRQMYAPEKKLEIDLNRKIHKIMIEIEKKRLKWIVILRKGQQCDPIKDLRSKYRNFTVIIIEQIS